VAFTQSDVLIARNWMPAPATFSASSSSYYRQLYDIEIFWEQSAGQMFHVYGSWRDLKLGLLNITIDDDALLNGTLDNLTARDDQTAKLCAN
jgi:hypothetical protein